MGIKQRILVTGAGGFLGQSLVRRLLDTGVPVRALFLTALEASVFQAHPNLEMAVLGPLETAGDFSGVFSGVSGVVHLAGRAHVLKEEARDPAEAFRAANVTATANLAQAAGKAGVSRFVFFSSIGVNGRVSGSSPFCEEDPPNPQDPYAVSKLEAEQALAREHETSGLPVTVLRPPLIYGPGAKGNVPRLLKLAASGLPLPLAKIGNKRSFCYLENLIDVVTACLGQTGEGYEIFLVSDGRDVTTAEMVACLRAAMGLPPRLFALPAGIMETAARLAGMGRTYDSLCGTLRIDPAKIMAALNWTPRFTPEQGLAATAAWWRGRG